MKRILVIAPYAYLPYYSGGQNLIAQFLYFLGKRTQLTVISTRKNDESLAHGYKLLRWLVNPFIRYIDLRLYFRLDRLVKTSQFDAIIWEHPYYYWLARMIQAKHGIFTIIHSHNIEYQRFRSTGKWWWRILRCYEGACLKQADFVYFISQPDRAIGQKEWKLDPAKCDIMPFGIQQDKYPADRTSCQQTIRARHQIPAEAKILLFNGLLSYPPNRQAVDDLLHEINPRLLQDDSFSYRLIICGKGLPDTYRGLENYRDQRVIFAGFVEDIETYFKGADVFLNPVLSGGGIKTKMVEAIGFGTTVVSTQTGSTGIESEACGAKLRLVADHDWDQFCRCIREEAAYHAPTPAIYYEQYHWGNLVGKIPARIELRSKAKQ